MRISFVNQKGGVGKTTLAVHIADALARLGKDVLLIDADQQRSALDWSAMRTGEPLFPVIGLPKNTIHKELAMIANGYDITIIDGPARYGDIAGSAIAASDIVFIPVQPCSYDVWASSDVIELVEKASIHREFKTAFILNRKILNSVIGREVRQALAVHPYPVLETAICNRVVFADTVGQGQTVTEAAPRSRAAREIKSLTHDIMELINDEEGSDVPK